MAARKAKTMTAKEETAIVAISPEIIDGYVTHKYLPEDVEALEEAARHILHYKRSSVEAILSIGAVLNGVKANTPHGDFGYFVEYRALMTMDTANRAMASARFIDAHPQLRAAVDNLKPTTLYLLAQNKRVNDEVIDRVIDYAGEGELEDGAVRDIIDEIAPKPSPKPRKLPFNAIDTTVAAAIADKLTGLLNDLYMRNARAIDPNKVVKSAAFKSFVKEFLAVDSDMSRAVNNLLALCFVVYESTKDEEEPLFDEEPA